MLNFWALSAIAAFCLGEVLSINFGDPLNDQSVPWGGSGGTNIPTLPNRGSGGSSPTPDLGIPNPKFGDDQIRIASITLFCRVTFYFGHFIAASN